METEEIIIRLEDLQKKCSSVLDPSIPTEKYIPINISSDNSDLQDFDVSNSTEWTNYIDNYLQQSQKLVAYGGYLENRNIYKRSTYFSSDSEDRNIHLGMDLWSKTNTSVHAILEGTIHSFKNNQNYGDYGPTLILKHVFNDFEFYTLYGHLSLDSLDNKSVGQVIKSGEQIGKLGDQTINGDYAPHLHFQLILDLEGKEGDYPGVCASSKKIHYSKNCPDPNILLGI